jgi:hypothetical protein
VLVSAIMIAQAKSNRWSELLSSIWLQEGGPRLPKNCDRPSMRFVSNPAQNRQPWRVILDCREAVKGESMEPYRPSVRRRLFSVLDVLGKLLRKMKPRAPEIRLQMMCPFCGLITARANRLCLECGKPLRAVQAEQKAAPQEIN